MIRRRSRRRPGAQPPPPQGRRRLLSILLAVVRPEGLVDELHALPTGDRSPFADLPGTHNGRFTVVDHRQRGDGFCPLLAVSATVDGEPGPWIDAWLTRLGPDRAEAILGRCAGWPGHDGAAAWLTDHLVAPTLPFATWEAPVDTIVHALALTDAVRAFALETKLLTPAERKARFLECFGSPT